MLNNLIYSRRFWYGILVFLSVYLLPIYFPIALCIIGILVFHNYYEAIFLGFLLDIIYFNSGTFIHSHRYIFSALIAFLILSFLKRSINFSNFR